MKIKKKTITQEINIYYCDECDFTSESKIDAGYHIVEHHSVEKRLYSDDYEFVKFSTKKNASKWVKNYGLDREVNWVGPGWYTCSDCKLIPFEQWVENMQKQAKYFSDLIVSTQILIHEAENEP